MAHWYNDKGELVPDFNLRSKASKQLYRDRKIFPSHTTIPMEKAMSYGLKTWIEDQLIMSALTTPRIEGESDEDFIKRIRQHAQEEKEAAAEFGTTMHNLIERVLKNECIQMAGYSETIQHGLISVKEWIDENIERPILIESTEINFIERYAGKLDLYCELKSGEFALIDWKTKKTEYGKKIYGYDNYIQLASQAMLIHDKKVDRYFNGFISSTEPGRFELVEYSEDDIQRGWIMFDACLTLFNAKIRE
jgi:hypothetical protein